MGGLNSYGADEASKIKMRETVRIRREAGAYKSRAGENSATNILTKDQVSKIYTLIKKFHSNREIIEILELSVGITTLNQIRHGKNWQELFKEKNMTIIPSLNTVKGALNSQEKIEVLGLIEKGTPTLEIKEKYKLSTTDIERIKKKCLWKMAWNVYENYYKQTTKIKNE